MDESTGSGQEDVVKLTFWLATNKVGSKAETVITVPADEWSELSEAERHDYAKEMFLDIALDRLGSWDWEEK